MVLKIGGRRAHRWKRGWRRRKGFLITILHTATAAGTTTSASITATVVWSVLKWPPGRTGAITILRYSSSTCRHVLVVLYTPLQLGLLESLNEPSHWLQFVKSQIDNLFCMYSQCWGSYCFVFKSFCPFFVLKHKLCSLTLEHLPEEFTKILILYVLFIPRTTFMFRTCMSAAPTIHCTHL